MLASRRHDRLQCGAPGERDRRPKVAERLCGRPATTRRDRAVEARARPPSGITAIAPLGKGSDPLQGPTPVRDPRGLRLSGGLATSQAWSQHRRRPVASAEWWAPWRWSACTRRSASGCSRASTQPQDAVDRSRATFLPLCVLALPRRVEAAVEDPDSVLLRGSSSATTRRFRRCHRLGSRGGLVARVGLESLLLSLGRELLSVGRELLRAWPPLVLAHCPLPFAAGVDPAPRPAGGRGGGVGGVRLALGSAWMFDLGL